MLSTDAIAALAGAGGPTARPLPRNEKLAGNDAEAFQQFEALLLGEVLKGAQRSSLSEDHALSGGSAGKMYREMFMDELAAGLSQAGGVGIARELGARAALRLPADGQGSNEEKPGG